MKPSPPGAIFLIHHGHQDYLRIAASEAKASGNSVILVGNDEVTAQLCDAYYDDANVLLPEYEAFEREYVHLSSASREFELLCFKRYFYLLAVAKQRDLDHFWLIDSDAIVLRDLQTVANDFLLPNGYWAGVSTRHQDTMDWASCPHTSFWTLAGLHDFVEFLLKLYRAETRKLLDQKYQWHLQHQIPGGICDMTALFLWQQQRVNKVYNLAIAHENGLPFFDNNLNEDGNCAKQEFQMVGNVKLKKISFSGGRYWAHPINGSHPLEVAALHFQGRAKACMATFQHRRKIHYSSYASYTFWQYCQKRIGSLKRKYRTLFDVSPKKP